jgi:hypothetical protein
VAVKIKDLVDEMDMQMDEYNKYLNKETGEIVTVSTEDLSIAEDSEEDEDFSQYPDWQRESLQEALNVIAHWGKYIGLPDKWEIHEYDIMERFCSSIENNRISDALYSAIKGKGAFRRFKDTLQRYGIEQKWYSFHEKALRDIAIRWCEDEGIEYAE